MNLDLQSHRTQLVLTALAASAATAGVFSAYQQYTRRQKRRELNDDILRSIAFQDAKGTLEAALTEDDIPGKRGYELPALSGDYSEELIREQLARNYAFFGDEGMDRIRKSKVVVVGCGGVGSYAAMMLVRSGVSDIRLIDHDLVSLSSLNRHATAVLADVGIPKVTSIERMIKSVCRWVNVDSRAELWDLDHGGAALLEGADWVVDAIDNIDRKIDLLKYCHDNGIKVFSSMGAGTKSDPTRIQISDISYTVYDPLARSVRRRLRVKGISSGIPVVYSTESPGDVKLLPLSEEEFKKGNVKELGAIDNFRVRIVPVLGPLPSIFGLNIAAYVLCELAGKPIANPLAIKGRKKLYERVYRELLHREERIVGHPINRLPIDEEDVGLLFEDLYRGRSVVPPHAVPTRPALVRWDPSKPLTLDNCVAMEDTEAARHVKGCFGDSGKAPREVWGDEITGIVHRRAEEILQLMKTLS